MSQEVMANEDIARIIGKSVGVELALRVFESAEALSSDSDEAMALLVQPVIEQVYDEAGKQWPFLFTQSDLSEVFREWARRTFNDTYARISRIGETRARRSVAWHRSYSDPERTYHVPAGYGGELSRSL